MTSPRTPTYRTTPASQPWHRDQDDHSYRPRHKASHDTTLRDRAPVIVARHTPGAR